MSADTTYNGWTNYETWLVNLWIDNDGGQERYAEEALQCLQNAIDAEEIDPRASAITDLASIIESDHDDGMAELVGVHGVFRDLLAGSLGRVDWREIARHYIDEIKVYSAGWNMPGYMPDNPPELFIDAGDALESIKDAATRAIEESEDASDAHLLDGIAWWKANSNGEFGQTVGGYHYFVNLA